MKDHFTITSDPSKRRADRPHTVLTHAFSHKDRGHLFDNMVTFWVVATPVLRCLGSYRHFFYCYIGSIYFSQAFGDLFYHWLPDKPARGTLGLIERTLLRVGSIFNLRVRSLGASGAVSALLMFFWLSFPNAWVTAIGGAYFALIDLIPAIMIKFRGRTPGDNVGYMSHVGGHLFGVFAWLLHRKPLLPLSPTLFSPSFSPFDMFFILAMLFNSTSTSNKTHQTNPDSTIEINPDYVPRDAT